MGNTEKPIGSNDFFVAPRGVGIARRAAAIGWRREAVTSPSRLIVRLNGLHCSSGLTPYRATPAVSLAEVTVRRSRRFA
jgi:hypothetical protein